MMPQEYLPDVERDHSRQDLPFFERPLILDREGMPILCREAKKQVLEALGSVVRDQVVGFEALTTHNALLVSVIGRNATYSYAFDKEHRNGFDDLENIVRVLGVFGNCNAARQSDAA